MTNEQIREEIKNALGAEVPYGDGIWHCAIERLAIECARDLLARREQQEKQAPKPAEPAARSIGERITKRLSGKWWEGDAGALRALFRHNIDAAVCAKLAEAAGKVREQRRSPKDQCPNDPWDHAIELAAQLVEETTP